MMRKLDPKSAEERILSNPKHRYTLRPAVALAVVDAKLSPTAYRLWLYLCILFPFGDRPIELPTQPELATRLGVNRRSILRAMAELEELELWDFTIEQCKGQNLTGQKCHTLDKNVTPEAIDPDKNVTPCDKNVTPCDKNVTSRSPELAQGNDSGTPHDLTDLNNTFKDSLSPTHHPESESEIADAIEQTDPVDEQELLEFTIGKVKGIEGIRNPRAYAIKVLRDDRAFWESEYRKHRQTLQEINLPPPPPEHFETETPVQRLTRYQSQWQIPVCRSGIKRAIEAHPEWGLVIGKDGPEPANLAVEVGA